MRLSISMHLFVRSNSGQAIYILEREQTLYSIEWTLFEMFYACYKMQFGFSLVSSRLIYIVCWNINVIEMLSNRYWFTYRSYNSYHSCNTILTNAIDPLEYAIHTHYTLHNTHIFNLIYNKCNIYICIYALCARKCILL